MDRKLTKPGEFERFAGRLARISTIEPVENAKFFEGRLAGYAEGRVKIEVKGRIIELPSDRDSQSEFGSGTVGAYAWPICWTR